MTRLRLPKRYAALLPVLMFLVGFMQSCKEDIDMSNRYTFKEYTIASYLDAHDSTYSDYLRLLNEVKISRRSQSSVYQLLSARGKYTVFAPTNKAIQDYLDTLAATGVINSPSWDGFKNENDLDSIKQVIVYNSILDGTKNDIDPIQSGSFPDEDGEEIPLANMNDRKLTVYRGKDPDSVYVNGAKDKAGNIIKGSLIDLKNYDIYTINGYIHQVHSVVAPSNETLADLLISYITQKTGDYIVAAKLMQATGMIDTLTRTKDEVYEDLVMTEDARVAKLPKRSEHTDDNASGDLPEHRYYGYTLFAETDDFWRSELGKEPTDIAPADIQAWVVSKGYYPEGKDNTDYTDENNVLNLFFTYHLLPMRLSVDKLVLHYNERGYTYHNKAMAYTVPTYELYTTMGKRRLLKLYQCGPRFSRNGDNQIYLNRFPLLDNGRTGSYGEQGSTEDKGTGSSDTWTPDMEGIAINTANSINLVNAYIYPIDKPLAYDETTRENLQKQRLRFDVTSLFPEFMNNDLRANFTKELFTGMPTDENYKYLNDLDIMKGTRFYYLSGLGRSWLNWQGDELNVQGSYEMIFRLPPVPKAGTYEIRYAIQSNSERRSMCQVYFGTDKKNLPAMGIPLDLRTGGQYRHLPSTAGGNLPSIVGWLLDTEDQDYNAEVDKKMRNNGYMKGPAIYAGTPGGSNFARNNEENIRRIIVREFLYPDKVYYLKFKTVLEDEDKEFYMDYLEFCAKEVYDNPATPEDIW